MPDEQTLKRETAALVKLKSLLGLKSLLVVARGSRTRSTTADATSRLCPCGGGCWRLKVEPEQVVCGPLPLHDAAVLAADHAESGGQVDAT